MPGSVGLPTNEINQQQINLAIQQAQQGHLNCVVQATLNANATSTTVVAPTCTAASAILPCPLNQDAANQMATMSFAPASGQFVITHASNARVDQTFNFAVIG